MTEEKARILLVDDDKFLLEMYAMKFNKEGYVTLTCLSADDALTQLRGGYQPDVILFDLIMPVRDGFQLLEAMRAEKLAEKSIKIALTNQSSDAEKVKAEELGADHFFIKATMIPSEVVNMVQGILSKQKKT